MIPRTSKFVLRSRHTPARDINISQSLIKLGSDEKCSIRLVGDQVARLHAVIEVKENGEAELVDLNNGAPVLVNGNAGGQFRLQPGDTISIADTQITYLGVASGAEVPARSLDTGSYDWFRAEQKISPFAAASPWAPAPRAETRSHKANSWGEGGYSFPVVGPAPETSEVEDARLWVAEIRVLWRGTTMHVIHTDLEQPFVVGEVDEKSEPNSVFLPEEELPARRIQLLEKTGENVTLAVCHGFEGKVQRKGQEAQFLRDLRAASANATSDLLLPIGADTEVTISYRSFSFEIAWVPAGRALPKGALTSLDRSVPGYFGLTFATFAGLFSALAFFVPPMGLSEDEGISKERLLLIQQYLSAAQEREEETLPPEADSKPVEENGGPSGDPAKGAAGELGKNSAPVRNTAYGVKGDPNNTDTQLARQAAREDASTFGMISILSGDPNAPTSPFGADFAIGRDALSAQGKMWGVSIDDAFGHAGLGLSGIGEGAGGNGLGIGINGIGGLGRGLGGNGLGPGHFGVGGRPNAPGHKPKAPKIGTVPPTASGSLPAEVIQRVVRQNFGRFRMCYEQGLTRNPNLEGRVSVRFVIGADGAVSTVGNGGSDLPDQSVVSCIVSSFYGISFPKPERGIVTVTYPLMMNPE